MKLKTQQDADKAKQIEDLNGQLQAKAEAKRAQTLAVVSKPRSVTVSGSCAQWIAQAGITDVANAMDLVNRESGCNPNAVNRSSGACGLAQELPCGKSGCSLGDGGCQMAWMKTYVFGRYGSFMGAIAFHNANHWY